MKIALLQMSMTDVLGENLQKALDGIRTAAQQGAQIICLPELFLSPYFCKSESHKYFDLAEAVPGNTTQILAEICAELDVTVIASLFEKVADGLYFNTTAVLDGKQGYIGKYRKMHIPDDPLFYEKFYFTPGDLGFKSFATQHGNLGILICWDQWYPEAARLTALKGADILFYPTAIGYLPSDVAAGWGNAQEAWETIQRSHAIANGCFVVSVNRVGYEALPPDESPELDPGIHFWGNSFVAAPDGRILVKGDDKEQILYADVDLSEIKNQRQGYPFFRDRRIDAYDKITKRWDENP